MILKIEVANILTNEVIKKQKMNSKKEHYAELEFHKKSITNLLIGTNFLRGKCVSFGVINKVLLVIFDAIFICFFYIPME